MRVGWVVQWCRLFAWLQFNVVTCLARCFWLGDGSGDLRLHNKRTGVKSQMFVCCSSFEVERYKLGGFASAVRPFRLLCESACVGNFKRKVKEGKRMLNPDFDQEQWNKVVWGCR